VIRLLALLASAALLGACATHSPRYFGDDGPPDHVPSGIAGTPDAVPRVEAINPYANRPYSALGRTYTPDTGDAPFAQTGFASWYGRQFQGNRTASGERYDMFAMTAAHPTLPIPSYARVTNLRDGRSVIVRINDRGPFLQGRVIDLSYAAAVRLGIAIPGSGEVRVEKITSLDIASGRYAAPPQLAAATASQIAVQSNPPPARLAPRSSPVPDPIAASQVPSASAVAPVALLAPVKPVASALPSAPLSTSSAFSAPPLSPAPIELPADASGGPWSVQLGAFAVEANATALRDRLALLLSAPDASGLPAGAHLARVEFDGQLSRVLIGALPDRTTALAWAQELERFLDRPAVVHRSNQ